MQRELQLGQNRKLWILGGAIGVALLAAILIWRLVA